MHAHPVTLASAAALALAPFASGQTIEQAFEESQPITTLPSLEEGTVTARTNPATGTPFFPYAPPELADDALFPPAGIVAHPAQILTIFEPEGASPGKAFPTVIYCRAGSFVSIPPATSVIGFLARARDEGFVVITVGTTGSNSAPTSSQPPVCTNGLPTGCRDPNLFYDPDADYPAYRTWYDFKYFFGEKDLAWAVQFVKNDAVGLDTLTGGNFQIDTARIILAGTSTGGIYSSFLAFGPNRAWGGIYGAQMSTDTRVAGLIWFEPTAWPPALPVTRPQGGTYQGAHWPESFIESESEFYYRSPIINATPTEPLLLSGALRIARENRPLIPVFIASGDGSFITSGFGRNANESQFEQDEDFDRYGPAMPAPPPFVDGDPIVYFPTGIDSGTMEPIPEFRLHDAWNVVSLARELRNIDDKFHERYTRAFLRDDVEFNRWPATETISGIAPNASNPDLEDIPLLFGTYAAANAAVSGFSPSVDHPGLAGRVVNWMKRTFCIEGYPGVYCRNVEPNCPVLIGTTFIQGGTSTITVAMNEAPEVYDAALLLGFGAAATLLDTNGEYILCVDDGRGELLGQGMQVKDSSGIVQYTISIPNDPSLQGTAIYTQARLIDLDGAAPDGWTNAQDMIVQAP